MCVCVFYLNCDVHVFFFSSSKSSSSFSSHLNSLFFGSTSCKIYSTEHCSAWLPRSAYAASKEDNGTRKKKIHQTGIKLNLIDIKLSIELHCETALITLLTNVNAWCTNTPCNKIILSSSYISIDTHSHQTPW